MPSLLSSSRRSLMRSSRDSQTPSRPSHRNRNNNNDDDSARPPTPEYEPLCTPLNAAGQRALAALLSASSFRQLTSHIQQAGEKLTETAAEANERATDARARYESMKSKKLAERRKKKASSRKKRNKGRTTINEDGEEVTDENQEQESDQDEEMEGEEEEEEEEDGDDNDEEGFSDENRKLELMEGKVKELTGQLEERMRGVVDGEYKLSGLKQAVEGVQKEAEEAGAAAEVARRRSRLRNRRQADEDEEMADADDNEDEDEDENDTITVVPTQAFKDKLGEHDSEWEKQSLTQRYSQNNAYVGFYRVVHDAKFPGNDIPPVPHPSTWFSHIESSSASADGSASPVHGRIRDQSPDDENDDIAIERERISLQCPLTLRTFEDPVKSTKCVHSFERQAIQDLIKNSSMTVAAGDQDFQAGGRGARARRVRAVQCPVCSVALTLNDLKPDPVLLRRVLRAKAAEQREEEEAQFDGRRHHRKGGRKSGFTIASDDDDEVSIDDDDDENEEEEEEDDDDDDDDEDGAEAASRVRIKRERSRFSSRAPHDVDEIEDD